LNLIVFNIRQYQWIHELLSGANERKQIMWKNLT
jgi:hypothetical protein